jgi:hypothetical protein
MAEKDSRVWSSEIPKKTGWYWVKWEPNDNPVKIYITFSPKSNYPDDDDIGEEGFSTWGWDEHDDPESLGGLEHEQAVYSFIGVEKER